MEPIAVMTALLGALYLFGRAPASNPDVVSLCSVDRDSTLNAGGVADCNIKDVLMLDLALGAPGATLDQVCERQRPAVSP